MLLIVVIQAGPQEKDPGLLRIGPVPQLELLPVLCVSLTVSGAKLIIGKQYSTDPDHSRERQPAIARPIDSIGQYNMLVVADAEAGPNEMYPKRSVVSEVNVAARLIRGRLHHPSRMVATRQAKIGAT